MDKIKISEFPQGVQTLLDVTLSGEFYRIYKEISKYNSYISFCRGLINSLKLKKDSGFAYLFRAMKGFNKVSGFSDDFSMEYIIDFLVKERYIKYYEIVELKYEISNLKK